MRQVKCGTDIDLEYTHIIHEILFVIQQLKTW